MKNRILSLLALIVLCTSFGAEIHTGTASAAAGGCYFGSGTCSVSGDGSYGTNDIFTGRTDATTQVLAGVDSKPQFINFIQNRFGGSTHNKTGAQFVIAWMLGNHSRVSSTAAWTDLMQQDSVSFRKDTVCVDRTSWYDPGHNDTFFDDYTGGCRSRQVIIISQTGVGVIARLEINCGNMTAFRNGPLIRWGKMVADSSVNPTQAYAGKTVNFSHNVQNNGNIGNGVSDPISGNVYWHGSTNAPVPAWSGSVGNPVVPDKSYGPKVFSPGESLNRSYSFTIPNNAPIGSQYCQNIRGNKTQYNDFSNFASTPACVQVIAPPIPRAVPSAGFSTAPADFNPGKTVTATAAVNNNQDADTQSNWTRNIFIDNNNNKKYDAGDTIMYGPTNGGPKPYPGLTNTPFPDVTGVIPAGTPKGASICTSLDLIETTFNPANTTTTTYTFPDGTTNKGYAITCEPVIVIGAQPYFSVLGGDIAAGPGFGSTCSPTAPASIIGANNGGSTYEGAAAQLAALALTNITAFPTGKSQAGASWKESLTNGAPASGTAGELAFANSLSPNGSFNLPNWCVPNYYTGVTNTTNFPGSSVSGLGLGSATKSWFHNGNMTLTSLTIPANGEKIVLKVQGNVYITGGPGVIYGAAGSAAAIPQFQLIASGGIFLDPSVTRLDGFYAAQGGSFITCSDSMGTRISGIAAIALCNTKLEVNGAVAAKKVVPNRTYGDPQARFSQSREPSEIFRFSPQFWIPSISGGGVGSGAWQSVTSLPPIL